MKASTNTRLNKTKQDYKQSKQSSTVAVDTPKNGSKQEQRRKRTTGDNEQNGKQEQRQQRTTVDNEQNGKLQTLEQSQRTAADKPPNSHKRAHERSATISSCAFADSGTVRSLVTLCDDDIPSICPPVHLGKADSLAVGELPSTCSFGPWCVGSKASSTQSVRHGGIPHDRILKSGSETVRVFEDTEQSLDIQIHNGSVPQWLFPHKGPRGGAHNATSASDCMKDRSSDVYGRLSSHRGPRYVFRHLDDVRDYIRDYREQCTTVQVRRSRRLGVNLCGQHSYRHARKRSSPRTHGHKTSCSQLVPSLLTSDDRNRHHYRQLKQASKSTQHQVADSSTKKHVANSCTQQQEACNSTKKHDANSRWASNSNGKIHEAKRRIREQQSRPEEKQYKARLSTIPDGEAFSCTQQHETKPTHQKQTSSHVHQQETRHRTQQQETKPTHQQQTNSNVHQQETWHHTQHQKMSHELELDSTSTHEKEKTSTNLQLRQARRHTQAEQEANRPLQRDYSHSKINITTNTPRCSYSSLMTQTEEETHSPSAYRHVVFPNISKGLVKLKYTNRKAAASETSSTAKPHPSKPGIELSSTKKPKTMQRERLDLSFPTLKHLNTDVRKSPISTVTSPMTLQAEKDRNPLKKRWLPELLSKRVVDEQARMEMCFHGGRYNASFAIATTIPDNEQIRLRSKRRVVGNARNLDGDVRHCGGDSRNLGGDGRKVGRKSRRRTGDSRKPESGVPVCEVIKTRPRQGYSDYKNRDLKTLLNSHVRKATDSTNLNGQSADRVSTNTYKDFTLSSSRELRCSHQHITSLCSKGSPSRVCNDNTHRQQTDEGPSPVSGTTLCVPAQFQPTSRATQARVDSSDTPYTTILQLFTVAYPD